MAKMEKEERSGGRERGGGGRKDRLQKWYGVGDKKVKWNDEEERKSGTNERGK